MAARYCPRPFRLGTLKYYADRIVGGFTYCSCYVYYIIRARYAPRSRDKRVRDNGTRAAEFSLWTGLARETLAALEIRLECTRIQLVE